MGIILTCTSSYPYYNGLKEARGPHYFSCGLYPDLISRPTTLFKYWFYTIPNILTIICTPHDIPSSPGSFYDALLRPDFIQVPAFFRA